MNSFGDDPLFSYSDYYAGRYNSFWSSITGGQPYNITPGTYNLDPSDTLVYTPLIKPDYNIIQSVSEDSIYDINSVDLSQKHILHVLEAMKGRLMLQHRDVVIDYVECTMTETVKSNIIKAYKKLNMYGKKTPFIPRFDECMNELPQRLDVAGGMMVNIINSDEHGEYYLKLKAVLLDIHVSPDTETNKTYIDTIDDFYSGYGFDDSTDYDFERDLP